jgi:hypothetical protein
MLVLAIFLVAASLVFLAAKRRGSAQIANTGGPALRDMFLSLTPADAGITPPPAPNGVWAAAMDMSFPNGSATLVFTVDGAASLYFSSGGGVIGGEAHEKVRKAATRFVQAAEACSSHMANGSPMPLPAQGRVRFYAHSRSGLLVSQELPEDSVTAAGSDYSACFAAANDVITELRQSGPDA